MNAIKNFINDEAGLTAIEYALMAAGVAAAIAAGIVALGPKITAALSHIGDLFPSATKP